MPRYVPLIIGLALAILTPVMASGQGADNAADPAIVEANQAKARAEAREAQYKAQRAEAEARLAPLQQFAGDGTTHIENGGGQMEAAYLSAVTVADVARIIHQRVSPVTNPDLQGLPVLLLTNDENLSFDVYSGFRMEAGGLIRSSLRVLNQEGPNCLPPAPTASGAPDLIPRSPVAAAGAIIGMLQSETHVYGFDQLGDDALLANAIAANAGDRYLRQGAVLGPPEADPTDPVNLLMTEIGICENALNTKIGRMPKQTDEQKAAVAAVQAVLARVIAFQDRMTTPAADGSVRLASALRQSYLMRAANNLVLRVRVNRAGGTMITVKNLWTAIGLPAIRLSGGAIASYTLTERTSGLVRLSGTVVCRTELTGLRSAMRLRQSALVCSANPPSRDAPRNAVDERRRQEERRLDYDPRIFAAN